MTDLLIARFSIFISFLVLIYGCGNPAANEDQESTEILADQPSEIPSNPLKEAYFGDTHVHTGWSFDAGLDGAILTPEDGYRYAFEYEN